MSADAFNLLERLVAEASTVGQEADAQEVLANELAELGMTVTKLFVGDEIRLDPLAGVPQLSYRDRYNVLASTAETSGNSLLINGHIDVVPAEGPGWSHPPFQPHRSSGRLFGRGAGDMKGGMAMAVLALWALKNELTESLDGPIRFLSVIEEECTGNGTLAALRAGITADAVIMPEPTNLEVLVGGVGILWLEVHILTGGGHAERSDRLKSPPMILAELIGAVADLEAKYNQDVEDEFAEILQPYNINIGRLEMGDWPSSVASFITLGIRVGFPTSKNPDDVIKDVAMVVESVIGANRMSGVTINPHGFRAQRYLLSPDHSLPRAVAEMHLRANGVSTRASVLGSTTDARYYVNQAKIPAICLGPRVENMHGTDESVDLASIVEGAKTYARFIANYMLCGGLSGFEEGHWS